MIGVAAGFSASFKAPLTGLLFALELPYRRDLEKDAFIEAAIACSAAYLVSAGLGAPSLVPPLELEVVTLPLYWLPISMTFGLVTGAVVIGFTGVYSVCERLAKQIVVRGGYPLMLLLGGFLLGGVGYLAPQAVGPGYQMFALMSGGAVIVVTAVFLLRAVATGVTMNFGGTGGLFLPALLIGGAWGTVVGSIIMPSFTPIFVVMGMAAFSAGIHKMMLTPIVFVAEAYGAPNIIPIILATVVCFFVTATVPFYPIQPTNKVDKEELALERFYYKVMRSRPREMEKLTSGDVSTKNPIHLHANITVREAMDAFGKTSFRLLPVVDSEEMLVGYVTLEDLAFLSKTALDMPLSTVELQTPLSFGERVPIFDVIGEMVEKEEDHCFVVDAEGRLTGIISGIDVTRLLMRYYTQT
jgi:CIC family chloride channel protein